MTKPVITTRASKGSALSWTEGDTNLTNLRDATITVSDGTTSTAIDLNGTITFTAGSGISIDESTGTITIANTQSAGAANLDGLSDVVITSAASGDILYHNGTNWVDTAASSLTVNNVSGTVAIANGGTGTTTAPAAINALTGYTTTATSGGTLTLTNASTQKQIFTGSSAHFVYLPDATTLGLGWTFNFINNSTGTVQIYNPGFTLVAQIYANQRVSLTCTSIASSNGSWTTTFDGSTFQNGTTGSVVVGTGATLTSPTLVTPALGTPASGTLSSCTVDGTNAIGFKNLPPVGTKTTSYTLATTDKGKYVQVGSGGSITIPNSTFAEGDCIVIANNHSAGITITCSTTNAYIAGTDTNKTSVTLATRGLCNILFLSSTVCIISGNIS